MDEILNVIGMLIFMIAFKTLSWFQFICASMFIKTLQYVYKNKKYIKKFIKKQENNLTIKKSFVIILIGIPLIMVDIINRIYLILKLVGNLFIKTYIGKEIYGYLDLGNQFIVNQKKEMKNKLIGMLIKNFMPKFDNNMGGMGGLGDMSELQNMLNNPNEMNKMMESFNKMMGGMNLNNNVNNNVNNRNKKLISNSKNKQIQKPKIESDLFDKINKYIEDDTTSINNSINNSNSTNNSNSVSNSISNSISTTNIDNKEKLSSSINKSKKINKKMRKKLKKKVNSSEFEDVKNLTVALQETLKALDVD